MQRAVTRLERRGLVHACDARPANGGCGRPQLIYDMIRTERRQ